MNALFGSLFSRLIGGIMFMVFVSWVFMGATAYERSNAEFEEVKQDRPVRAGSFGADPIDPSDPYRARVQAAERDTFRDPYARASDDDVIKDAPHYGGSDWGN